VSRRAEELASELDREFSRMIELVGGLSPHQVQAPCEDSQGQTVGAVLAHLREGTHLVVDWAAGLAGAGVPTPRAEVGAAVHDHGNGHRHEHVHHQHDDLHHAGHHEVPDQGRDDGGHGHGSAEVSGEVASTVDTLRSGGQAFVSTVRGLPDDQLDSFPPAVPGLTDGSLRLDRLCAFIAEDLAAHRSHLEQALTGSVLQDER
jgi:hypothetical protein